MSTDTPNGPIPNASPVAFPNLITSRTPTPFRVYRNLELDDGTFISCVRIDILRADWEAVEDEGFCGDWEAHLDGGPLTGPYALTDEQREEAADCVGEFLETLAAKLARGEAVKSYALASPAWRAKGNWNLDSRLT